MAITNTETKEIHCKIIYFGPEGAGKTCNLRSLYEKTAQEIKIGTKKMGPAPLDRPSYFDFLPLSIGQVHGYHIKLHLFSFLPNKLFETTTKILLKGVDGFVFVADSQIERLHANIEAYQLLEESLKSEVDNIDDIPRVFQYNKRDLGELVPLEILRENLNPQGFGDFEAVASKSVGTMETLQAMTKQVLYRLAQSAES